MTNFSFSRRTFGEAFGPSTIRSPSWPAVTSAHLSAGCGPPSVTITVGVILGLLIQIDQRVPVRVNAIFERVASRTAGATMLRTSPGLKVNGLAAINTAVDDDAANLTCSIFLHFFSTEKIESAVAATSATPRLPAIAVANFTCVTNFILKMISDSIGRPAIHTGTSYGPD